MVKTLVSGGANVNARDEFLETPLHKATRHGEVDCVTILLRSGARVDAVTSDGLQALHLSASKVCFLSFHYIALYCLPLTLSD